MLLLPTTPNSEFITVPLAPAGLSNASAARSCGAKSVDEFQTQATVRDVGMHADTASMMRRAIVFSCEQLRLMAIPPGGACRESMLAGVGHGFIGQQRQRDRIVG